MKKALVSVTGLDATGIIARVSTKLYELNGETETAGSEKGCEGDHRGARTLVIRSM